MKKIFSVGEAAKLAGMTAETLRHYDRIGLVSPHKKDEWTRYRYYTEDEIVRLHTVHALRCMDLPLAKIKMVLELNDFPKIVKFLESAEKKADEKIAELQNAKARIRRAKAAYEGMGTAKPAPDCIFIRELPQRVILLSDKLTEPTVENLWNYLRHFFAQVGEERRSDFAFEDAAGIYETEEKNRLFAICTRYAPAENLLIMPAGKYLCAECTEQTRPAVKENLLRRAREKGAKPQCILHIVVLTGILQWKYELQVRLGE